MDDGHLVQTLFFVKAHCQSQAVKELGQKLNLSPHLYQGRMLSGPVDLEGKFPSRLILSHTQDI